ncbi:thylakoid lumenal 15 kDa protein 1 [Pyrus ussuriensis x Pyrus communis]|uniref:Thylakoid lumenal 15 kDa protein 1 n=1 Tax=Pyrus ussuriensis x Pyrus communis TaxID=2448454 RepID=A0A5N5F5P0_9ROSA|nr:thylakoid lumenal 15 kDa protein 1 [Pyrus ussuriensis x Pyrus communis]
MALLNVSTCSSKLQQTSPFPPTPPSLRRLSCAPGSKQSPQSFWKLSLSLGESVCKASLIALLSASVFVANPALAFKSILRQANFKGAKLLGASFFDADLTDLRAVDFSLANVTKANLSNANLEGAVATGNTYFIGSNKCHGCRYVEICLMLTLLIA